MSESSNDTAVTLREWRERCGYSHRQAALALGVPRGTFIGWLSGRRRPAAAARATIERVIGETAVERKVSNETRI